MLGCLVTSLLGPHLLEYHTSLWVNYVSHFPATFCCHLGQWPWGRSCQMSRVLGTSWKDVGLNASWVEMLCLLNASEKILEITDSSLLSREILSRCRRERWARGPFVPGSVLISWHWNLENAATRMSGRTPIPLPLSCCSSLARWRIVAQMVSSLHARPQVVRELELQRCWWLRTIRAALLRATQQALLERPLPFAEGSLVTCSDI